MVLAGEITGEKSNSETNADWGALLIRVARASRRGQKRQSGGGLAWEDVFGIGFGGDRRNTANRMKDKSEEPDERSAMNEREIDTL
jgi:hypothetical protein